MAEKGFVLNSSEPLVFHNALDDWKVFHWTLADWTNYFNDQLLNFRVGSKKCSEEPQWERSCKTATMTLNQFNELAKDDSENWYYFDYKYLNDCCTHNASLLDDINWNCVGFPERTGKDSTLWIGSKGAHTPCHVDTYGCNFVAQIFGKKRWLLFAPDSVNLKPSRIPYEESSIYSTINFQCSHNYNDDLLRNAYFVELEPGDVLFVPPRWWHYVENLSTAISINTWVPLASDNLARLKECLVRFLVASIKPSLSPEVCLELLNPNEDDIESSGMCLEKLSFCINQLSEANQNRSEDDGQILNKRKKLYHLNHATVKKISVEQINSLQNVCSCNRISDKNEKLPLILKLIDSFCDFQIIDSVSKSLLGHRS